MRQFEWVHEVVESYGGRVVTIVRAVDEEQYAADNERYALFCKVGNVNFKLYFHEPSCNKAFEDTGQWPTPVVHSQIREQLAIHMMKDITYQCDCPVVDCETNNGDDDPPAWHMFGLIMHLNDGHSWTFDQIADWLDAVDADLRIA